MKGIFDLLEAMNAWEDTSEQGGNEWVEVLQIVEHILYQAFTTNNQDILESANYRLTQLLHKKVISSEEEVYHQIYQLTKVLLTLHCCGNTYYFIRQQNHILCFVRCGTICTI